MVKKRRKKMPSGPQAVFASFLMDKGASGKEAKEFVMTHVTLSGKLKKNYLKKRKSMMKRKRYTR